MERRVAGALAVRPEGDVHEADLVRGELAAAVVVLVEVRPLAAVDENVVDRDGQIAGVLHLQLLLAARVVHRGRWKVELAGCDRQLLRHPLAAQGRARQAAVAGVGDVELGAAVSAGRRREADAQLAALAGRDGDPGAVVHRDGEVGLVNSADRDGADVDRIGAVIGEEHLLVGTRDAHQRVGEVERCRAELGGRGLGHRGHRGERPAVPRERSRLGRRAACVFRSSTCGHTSAARAWTEPLVQLVK